MSSENPHSNPPNNFVFVNSTVSRFEMINDSSQTNASLNNVQDVQFIMSRTVSRVSYNLNTNNSYERRQDSDTASRESHDNVSEKEQPSKTNQAANALQYNAQTYSKVLRLYQALSDTFYSKSQGFKDRNINYLNIEARPYHYHDTSGTEPLRLEEMFNNMDPLFSNWVTQSYDKFEIYYEKLLLNGFALMASFLDVTDRGTLLHKPYIKACLRIYPSNTNKKTERYKSHLAASNEKTDPTEIENKICKGLVHEIESYSSSSKTHTLDDTDSKQFWNVSTKTLILPIVFQRIKTVSALMVMKTHLRDITPARERWGCDNDIPTDEDTGLDEVVEEGDLKTLIKEGVLDDVVEYDDLDEVDKEGDFDTLVEVDDLMVYDQEKRTILSGFYLSCNP
ncbi:hypothetical protein CANARDRAFT_20586 [[Candida] arabinofermentans NRRL YB-2248]|uniref:Uncharacterized protein n=1 Tax=[Candida] arabinofermentans NRRL YB-2248 TaxID=983967 RepID=A0A1E4T7W6_9ASCO|nr:hypothetical protein CANARDRAFT_20586 [[Candida] arabinofermentans NRRL YB-2248]